MNLIDLAESGWLPDWAIRIGIRKLLSNRLSPSAGSDEVRREHLKQEFLSQLRNGPLAVDTDSANAQHYEVPAVFFEKVLGPRLKYSCCHFENDEDSLAEAEARMLQITCTRAELNDSQNILELGCGWGSLTLWMAEHYPNSRITAISNSHGQREFIETRCAERGIQNVRVITVDMRDFDTSEQFDRVVSVEMFEHMRNYELLLKRISSWLRPGGKLFVHIFCHKETQYLFETEGASNWMGRHFFTGGMMPSDDLLLEFQDDLKCGTQWPVDGNDYWRTCERWLANLDAHREELLTIFAASGQPERPEQLLQRWRIFFMACGELFRFRGGKEWYVSHYLFEKQTTLPDQGLSDPSCEIVSAT